MIAPDSSLRAGFLKQVRKRPDAPALVIRGRIFTYSQVDHLARRWAAAVVHRLGRPATRIGVFASRSKVSYVAALAALYSGAAFVPLNPRYPVSRTQSMIRQAEPEAIFVDELASASLEAVLEGLPSTPAIWVPETRSAKELNSAEPLDKLPPVAPEGIAYLLFTSGSTGTPKGVPITHSNVRAFIDWAIHQYEFQSDDRFSQTFDQTFDLSVFDLFVAWEAGACVYAMSPVDLLAPAKFINANSLTVWFAVPSIPAQMRKRDLLKPGALPTLRWSLFCGEPLPVASAEAWQAAAPNSILENLYGPTELTIACMVHRWNPGISTALSVNGIVPIGKPYPGLTAVLLDRNLRPVADGEPGELCVSGPQTSPGYWNNPEKTAEKFVRLPECTSSNEIFYRTGDVVRQLANGEYVYLGRTDDQIKVLGFRVELGEIEGVLRRAGALQAVAVGWPVNEGTAQGVVAFVSGLTGALDRLKTICKQSLADYMVPARIIEVDRMPLNSNGKIDRAALKAQLETGSE